MRGERHSCRAFGADKHSVDITLGAAPDPSRSTRQAGAAGGETGLVDGSAGAGVDDGVLVNLGVGIDPHHELVDL